MKPIADREFLDFAKKRANWKGLAIHGMASEENTFFRMYVTSKIRHRVIPYLLGSLPHGKAYVNKLLDYLEAQITAH